MPDELSVKINLDQTTLQQGLSEAKQKVVELGEHIGVEGLKSERKLHHIFEGFLKGVLEGKDGADIFTGSIERIGTAFRTTLPLMLAFVAATEIFNWLKETKEASDKVTESLEKIKEVDADNPSVETLKSQLKELKDLSKEDSKRGLLARTLFGDSQKGEIASEIQDVTSKIRQLQQQKEDKESDSIIHKMLEEQGVLQSENPQLEELKNKSADEEGAAKRKIKDLASRGLDTKNAELELQLIRETNEMKIAKLTEEQAKKARDQAQKDHDEEDREMIKSFEKLNGEKKEKELNLNEVIAKDREKKQKENARELERMTIEIEEHLSKSQKERATLEKESSRLASEIQDQSHKETLSHLHLSFTQWKEMHKSGANAASISTEAQQTSKHLSDLNTKQAETNRQLAILNRSLKAI